jgi:hypothetical protein
LRRGTAALLLLVAINSTAADDATQGSSRRNGKLAEQTVPTLKVFDDVTT